MSSLKQAIVASLTEHPNAEKYRQRAFAENPAQLVEALAQKQVLTKADFLGTDDEGKPFIDSAGAWKNFDKIAEIIRLGGEKFSYDDFMSPMVSGTERTLLDSAKTHSGTAKVFTFGVWEGRFDDMEKLWYKLSVFERRSKGGSYSSDGMLPIDLKRQLLAAEGKTAPEDRLAKARLTLSDIRGAATSETAFKDVNDRLKAAGDYFRKDYVLMTDSAGDTMFDGRPGAWAKFDQVLKIMQAHGERLEAGDYTRKIANAQSLLEKAAEKGALNKVFTPEQWTDRLPEMLNLWSNVLPGWKSAPMSTQDFDNAYAEAENTTYAKAFMAKELNGKADLLSPLNAGLDEKPVLPLGLRVVWDNFDAVREHLSGKGEPLTVADLRTPSGQMGDSCLISAAKFGYFDKVVELARQGSQPITMDDFLSTDGHGNTLISILADKKQLSQVFTVEAWTGHMADMRALWSHVSASQRKQVNYQQLETGVKQATLKLQRKPGGIKIRPQ